MDSNTQTLRWSVMRGESPGVRAIEPQTLGLDIPDEVITWAEGYGLSLGDPDVYILVINDDETTGEVIGELDSMVTTGTTEEAQLIRDQLAAETNDQ